MFLETLEAAWPPCRAMSASISSRLYFASVPVTTSVLPASAVPAAPVAVGLFDVEFDAGVAQLLDDALAFAAVQEGVERVGDFGADAGGLAVGL